MSILAFWEYAVSLIFFAGMAVIGIAVQKAAHLSERERSTGEWITFIFGSLFWLVAGMMLVDVIL